MRPNLTAALIVLAIILFFVGRLTAPEKVIEDRHKIDSLTNDLKKATRQLGQATDSMNHYRILADTWYLNFVDLQKVKKITHTIYDNRKKAIDALPDSALYAEFRAVYPDK